MKYIISSFLYLLTFVGSAQNFTSYFTGTFEDMETTPMGGVCMMGGATENDEAMKWFLERANGGDILVLRASGSNGYNDYLYSELGIEVNSVESIVCLNEESADETYIHDRISKAEAIWFAGGDQWNYVDFWRNNIIEDLLNEAIQERNIVIGGTSAGMAILGGFYFPAQNGSITSSTALNNPYSPSAIIDSLSFLEVDYLSDVITDTHYDDPDRRGRHVTFLARILTDFNTVGKGIACEEYTSVCIDENGMARVYGDYPEEEDYAYFIQPNCELEDFNPEMCTPGEALTWNLNEQALKAYKVPGTYEGLNTFNLSNWHEGEGGTWEHWHVEDGEFFSNPGSQLDCSIGIDESWEDGLRIYPNPARDYVEINSNKSDIISVILYSIDGKSVLSETTTIQGNIRLNLSKLDVGNYIVEVTTANQKITRQIQKLY